MNNSLIYLASPYSHPDPMVRRKRFRIANQIAGRLLSAGHFVFSPISMSHAIAEDAGVPGTWEYWKSFDTAMLARCQKVVVISMDGLAESVGVAAEIAIAENLGIPVEYIVP